MVTDFQKCTSATNDITRLMSLLVKDYLESIQYLAKLSTCSTYSFLNNSVQFSTFPFSADSVGWATRRAYAL